MDETTIMRRDFDHYFIRRRLGAGEMGEVYLAEDKEIGRVVALKLLPPQVLDEPLKIESFIREVRLVSAVRHPNIVSVHAVEQVESSHYIISEFIEGESLRQRLERKRLNIGEAIDIAIQIASGLDAVHRVGIVHRDIKPENIMLDRSGFVKIADFGLAKFKHRPEWRAQFESHTPATSPGAVMGSVRYMSPEQVRGQEVNQQTDIWSLGVLLWEMVSHQALFQKITVGDTLTSILKDAPPSLGPEVPSQFGEIVTKALQKSEAQRYQTAGEMARDLKQLRQSLQLEKTAMSRKISEGSVFRRMRERLWGSREGISLTRGRGKRHEPVSKVLYINLWIENEDKKVLSTPVVLTSGLVYTFLFAIEGWSREEGGTSEIFIEPPELRDAPVTPVVIELLCSFLDGGGEAGYLRREVEYLPGIGFPPEAFLLKPHGIGRFFLTARLLIKGETIYREVLTLEVVGETAESSAKEGSSVVAQAY